MRRMFFATILFLSIGLALRADANRWWSHVKVLADDSMEGRNTGSPGHTRAAEYVASEFRKAGLEPAGTDGFIQTVAFDTRRIVESGSSLTLVRGDKTEPLTLGEDANISVRIDPAPSIDAPLVFVGYGLDVPEMQFDDLGDPAVRDALKNSVAVFLTGSPSNIPGPLRAHYQSGGERWSALRRSGAIGTISVANPKSMDIPWARSTLARLTDAWKTGDTGTVERIVLADLKQDGVMYQRLLVDRNQNWMPKLEALFARGSRSFVVVGAAHLVGPDGLLAMLKSKGYTVEQL